MSDWVYVKDEPRGALDDQYTEVTIKNSRTNEIREFRRPLAESAQVWEEYPPHYMEQHPGVTLNDSIGACLLLWAEMLSEIPNS